MNTKESEKVQVIAIARQFSRFPAGRFKEDGPYSGQAFRESFLVPAMKSGKQFTVELDGTAGFGSSFLEEAFGGLVRSAGWSIEQVMTRMKLKSSDQSLVEEIEDYVRNAEPANG